MNTLITVKVNKISYYLYLSTHEFYTIKPHMNYTCHELGIQLTFTSFSTCLFWRCCWIEYFQRICLILLCLHQYKYVCNLQNNLTMHALYLLSYGQAWFFYICAPFVLTKKLYIYQQLYIVNIAKLLTWIPPHA